MEQGINYIKKRLQEGATKEEIRKALIDGGWSVPHVEEAFRQAVPQKESWSNIPAPQRAVASSGSLPGVGSLFKEAITLYKQKFATILVISLINIIPYLGFVYLTAYNPALIQSGLLAILLIITLFISILASSVASFYVLSSNEKVSIGKAYKKAFSIDIFGIWWVSFLFVLIISGGFGLFIVPGIIFMVWFAFALFVFFNENLRGMNALLKSKEYVRGIWGKVFARMLPIIFIFVPLSIVLNYLVKHFISNAIVSGALVQLVGYLILTPIITSYYLALYNGIREYKGEISFVPKPGQKGQFILASILGMIVGWFLFGFIIATAVSVPFIRNIILNSSISVNWQEYTPPDKSFSVLFPSEVTVSGNEYISILNKNGAVLDVAFRTYPSTSDTGNPETDLQNFTKGTIAMPTTHSGYKAMDYELVTTRAYTRGRAIIAGDRLYQLAFIFTSPTYFNESDYNKFVNSFKILLQNNFSTSQQAPVNQEVVVNSQAEVKSRDAKRIADLKSVQNYVEAYFSKCGTYPGVPSSIAGCGKTVPHSWAEFAEQISIAVGVTVPSDPYRGYWYGWKGDGSGYGLGANLEANNKVLNDVGELDSDKGFNYFGLTMNCSDTPPDFGYCISNY